MKDSEQERTGLGVKATASSSMAAFNRQYNNK
jgi:hypothetical protein